MSALEQIKAYILVHYEDFPPPYVSAVMPQIEVEAQELHDAVAAELAEKIRVDKCGDTSPDGDMCPCGAAAADLIDPEVET
ncbi:hypothetical protein ACFWM7_01375 [Streptomyces sp. NPDC058375]|uniref:hypothetical protein n=1 Tax=Streptomyces sp. NPDC058375 TaxID=3346467 RepID=UPI003662CA1D